jgi:hypothetical protein
MTSTFHSIPIAAAFAAGGLLAFPAVNAATIPTHIGSFTDAEPTQTLHVRNKAWSDPAFGNMGWTHFSDWGTFRATKGQTVIIKAISANTDLHPGLTVWYRRKDDTAPDNYVADHFYKQNIDMFALGAKDENTGKSLGNVAMKVVKFGYDMDNNKKLAGLNGRKDKVSGQLKLTFRAPGTGTYLFVLGAVNPGSGAADAAAEYEIETTVTVGGP